MAVSSTASTASTAPTLAGPNGSEVAHGEAVVRAVGIIKIYKEGDTETVALQGANLELRHGEFATLVGPSGSGKSTLLWIAAGLTLPSAGQVFFGGRDLTRLDEAERAAVRAEHIGLVFQRGNLIPFLTAEENVALALQFGPRTVAGRAVAARRAADLLGEMGLGARRSHYPRQLSGGEVQRVGIALALAGDPQMLLGDEITGELDSATSERILTILFEAQRQRKMTVMIVTHNPELAAMGDRRLVIADGVVVEK